MNLLTQWVEKTFSFFKISKSKKPKYFCYMRSSESDSTFNNFVEQIVVAVNEYDRAVRRERIKRGIAAKRKAELSQKEMLTSVLAANLQKRKKAS